MKIKPKHMLILKLSSLGDILHALPTLKALRSRFPTAKITWLVDKPYRELIKASPYVDEVLSFEKEDWKRLRLLSALGKFIRLITHLRKERFDLTIDLQGLFRSSFIGLLSGAKTRIGFSNARELSYFFYSGRVVVRDKNMHAIDRYLLTARFVGCPDNEERDFTLKINEKDLRYIEMRLRSGTAPGKRPLVAVCPSARWRSKRWPAERFAHLCKVLKKEWGANVVIIGGKEDVEVANLVKTLADSKPLSLAGKTTLGQLTALLKKTNLLITNDSGPMHLAAALGTRVVAIFGPTDPRLTGPYGKGHLLVRKQIPCAPCRRKVCKEHTCMENITPEEVLKAVKQQLKLPL